MAEQPKPFMRGHQAFDALAAIAVRTRIGPLQHLFQNNQKVIRDIEIRLVTGMMKGNQNLIRQPSCVSWGAGRATFGACIPVGEVVFHRASLFAPNFFRLDDQQFCSKFFFTLKEGADLKLAHLPFNGRGDGLRRRIGAEKLAHLAIRPNQIDEG